ncbi:hypothetical protein LC728_10540 [Bacillus amyloliquefaciens]|uniref:hypothetical protein n=1 Tax=Bacillus amyloliquefaciens TaxID=1390 RepID=UPI001CD39848|nr:hypothetical protein [Bacillus amyloliquefaciens]MCA1214819.1 hypothetical protein [Bacillus amyloliquefaciens]
MNNNTSFLDQIEKAVRTMRVKDGRLRCDRNNEIQKIQEIQEVVKQKTSEFKAFHSEVEKVVEDNKSLRCALAATISENERLKNDMPRNIFAMSNELCRIRKELMDLSADNRKLKEDRKKLVGMLVKSFALNASLMDDLMPEWRHFAKELDDLEEALK